MEKENDRAGIQMVLSILWQNSSRQELKIWKNQSHQVFPRETGRKAKKRSRKKKEVTFNNSEDEDSDQGHPGKKFCQYHGTCGHITIQCTTFKALAN